mgnify:CR=1 FL=1
MGNYLRVRGEYPAGSARSIPIAELPPRARRIRLLQNLNHSIPGTTSACAENTCWNNCSSVRRWNYLRVRGEYMLLIDAGDVRWELPPRARRILDGILNQGIVTGTTSACAENTITMVSSATLNGNYLRVRGEYRVLGAM